LLIVAFATVVAGELKSDVVVISPLARVVCAALVTLSPMSPARQRQLLTRGHRHSPDLDVLCRGGSGDADEACAIRLHAEKLLGLLGYCYGTKADFGLGGGDERLRSGTKTTAIAPSALEPMDLAMAASMKLTLNYIVPLLFFTTMIPYSPDCRT